ncbi:unnamed protein product [Closterium sp. Yama58-4]|nr:unnamed protein product [Closterium sp. Yama58-4]
MADRKEGHAGGLDCSSRARRGDESSSSDSSSSYGSSHGSLAVADAAVAAAAADAESAAAEFAATVITSAAGSETDALLSFGASSSDPSTPRDDFSSTPGESPSPSPPSPQFAVSDAAQPWSRTGGAMALDAARLIQQVGMQQLMRRRQSPRRASAPEQLPDPQPSTWAYSRPVVILDAFWNLAFVVVTAITLFISQARNERPPAPLSICLARRIESANTMFSFAWWLVGFTWILSTIDDSFKDAPILSWATTAFLAFDVFFVVFCVAVACVVGMAVCCCLPCIIALIYAVADQEGATREQIEALPKQRHVEAEDAECCVCLVRYEDGCVLRELPCSHHFHAACIDKWLKSHPTCPLCKRDVTKGVGKSASPNTPPSSFSAGGSIEETFESTPAPSGGP